MLNFVTKDMFISSLPHDNVCLTIKECATQHKEEIVELIRMMMSKYADGLDLQRGAVFRFGHRDTF